MRSKLLTWVIPGILTVLIGTAATMQFAKPALEVDLATRANAALQSPDLLWAHVDFDGRDALLTGTSPSQTQSDSAAARIASLRGVRVVNRAVDQAPFASPYPFSTKMVGGTISLSGGAPDEAARLAIIAKAGLKTSDLKILTGVTNREDWLAATDFVMRQIRQFDEGEIKLTDMTLSMSGRAKSRVSYETISMVLDAALPDGVQIGEISIIPPLETPFTWQADYNGDNVIMRGFVPDERTIELIGSASPNNKTTTPNVVLASGAPQNFATNATALVSAFAKVTSGSALISDDTISFTGTPLSATDADDLAALLAPLNAEIDLMTSDQAASAQMASPEAVQIVAEADIKTPPLPLLDALAGPPDVSIDQPDAAPTVTQKQLVEITTPELPNLVTLASPPEMPKAPVPIATNPADEVVANTPEPAETPADETPIAATPDAPQTIITPPLPNLSALSTPPTMPIAESSKNDDTPADTPAKIAALPNNVESANPDKGARLKLCRSLVAGFQRANSILFAPASATIDDESNAPLGRLAFYLKRCPSVEIHVEGHTDSDGPDNSNLALSVARAESVVVELIARGIDPSRLYAIGYGESVPLVPNTTRDGKRQNRRIEFEILELAE